MGGRWLLRPLGVALAAPLAACLESPPARDEPSCDADTGIAEMALGRDHACARLDNGGVWCWGLNDQGQLGDGTRIDRGEPSPVAGLGDVIRLRAGQDHTCALRGDHTLWCWGSGSNGQLGAGDDADSAVPVEAAVDDVDAMSLGDDFTCAVTGAGQVYCWGENEHGQAGPDFDEVVTTPTRIAITGPASAVVTGQNHACALLEDRTVDCWGGADLGQLGDDTLAERGAGAPVVGIGQATALLSGRDHSCAVQEGGSLWCWGSNARGQLGFPGDNPEDACENGEGIAISCLPVEIDVGDRALAAVAGLHHTCAATAAGEVYCLGGNDSGQLGDGSFVDSAAPVKVQIGRTIAALAAGETQSCAATAEQEVYCWGSNRAGQLADTAALVTTSPARVSGSDGALSLAVGASHTCIRTGEGLECWGSNDAGELGDGSLQASPAPTVVTALAGAVERLGPGEEHTCVLNGAARVRCWGRNSHGELGPGVQEDYSLTAITVDLGGDVASLGSGDEHVCAARVDGDLYCWGSDSNGQLGNGVPETSGPVLVALPDVLEVAAGDEHTCALDNTGSVYCWGANESGQLGDNSTAERTEPAAAGIELGEGGATAIDAGDDFSCAVSAGQVYCWGANEYGQLGDGTTEPSLVPQAVALDGAAVSIALGTEHACAIAMDGGDLVVRCWGRNDGGQLGDGTTESSPLPVEVDLAGTPLEIAAGERHSCARVQVGGIDQVFCWGSDIDGRLGSGRVLYHRTPGGRISVCQ